MTATVKIELIDTDGLGRILRSDACTQAQWNRIRDLVIGVEPDARMGRDQIIAEWVSIQAVALGLAELRRTAGVSFDYDNSARTQLQRFGAEVRAVREAAGQARVTIDPSAVNGRLAELGFSLRQLKPFQQRDASKMASLPNGANFSVPGAGKTTVALAVHFLTRAETTGLLVVAPKNAFGAWDDVIRDSLAHGIQEQWGFTRLVGGVDNIAGLLRESPLRLIIGYEQLSRVRREISLHLLRHPFHVVLDESHRMKAGDQSIRGSTLLRMAHLPVRRDILSGTPLPRSIEDIAPQLDFLWPGQGIGRQAVYSNRPNDVLRPLYVRTTKHELDLPPVVRRFHQVPMSAPQVALYSLIRRQALARLAGLKVGSEIDLKAARRSVMRLLQASSNPILIVRSLEAEGPDTISGEQDALTAIFSAILEERDSPKITAACDLARRFVAEGNKVVIWSTFTYNVERISELLHDLGATFIHGGVEAGSQDDPSTREGRIALFHDDKSGCRVLVANPAACSEGISLHNACHHAIYLDRSFNAAHYLQSVDRIHRIGLKKGTISYINVLESVAPGAVGAVDYSVRRRLIDKLRVMSQALEDEDLERLALDEDDAETPHDWDMTLDDLADVIAELEGRAHAPADDEEI